MMSGKARLRAMEPEDLDFLYAMENDHEVWNVGNASVPYSRYVLHDYIANSSNDIYNDGQVRLIVEDVDGRTVGMVDVFDFNAQHRRAEVSVVVHKDFRRKGLAMSILEQIMHYALHTLHLHQLYAIVAQDNMASLALFDKAGFERSDMLKGWLYDGENYQDAIVMQKILQKNY